MKIFPHFNTASDCPLCGKNTDSPSTRIPDHSTEKDGNVECQQVHIACLDLATAKNDPEVVKLSPFQELTLELYGGLLGKMKK